MALRQPRMRGKGAGVEGEEEEERVRLEVGGGGLGAVVGCDVMVCVRLPQLDTIA